MVSDDASVRARAVSRPAMAEAQRIAAASAPVPSPSHHAAVPSISRRFRIYGSIIASIIGLVGLGGVVISVVNAATYQGPTAAAPAGNIPVTIWNALSTGGKQADATIDIGGTVSLGDSTLDLGSGSGGQNLIYGYVPFGKMHADDRLLKLETESGGTWTERFGVDKSGNVTLVGEVQKATGSQVWDSQTGNGNFRMTQQDGGGRFHMGWNVDGSNLSTGTYNTTGDPALWLRWSTDGFMFHTAPSGTAGNAITWDQVLNVNINGNVGIGKGSPAYTLDAASDTGAAILNVADTNTGARIYTGTRLARNTTEAWFIGMNDTDDDLRLRVGGADDVVIVNASGDVWSMGAMTAEGCFGASFVGLTTTGGTGTPTNTGVFKVADMINYYVANTKCDASYAGSHMCTVEEMLESIRCAVPASPVKNNGGANAWINGGPPGFTADANDCKGWTSSAASAYGRYWIFNNTTGGYGTMTSCNAPGLKIACCR